MKYDWNPPEATNAVQISALRKKIKLENEVQQLQGCIQHLQNNIGIEDLTVEEVADLQMVLMRDEDEELPLRYLEESEDDVDSDNDEMNVGNISNQQTINEERVYDPVAGSIPFIINVCFNLFIYSREYFSSITFFLSIGEIR